MATQGTIWRPTQGDTLLHITWWQIPLWWLLWTPPSDVPPVCKCLPLTLDPTLAPGRAVNGSVRLQLRQMIEVCPSVAVSPPLIYYNPLPPSPPVLYLHSTASIHLISHILLTHLLLIILPPP